jgi:hypothetical protein
MNKPDTQLKDLIHVERGIIPPISAIILWMRLRRMNGVHIPGITMCKEHSVLKRQWNWMFRTLLRNINLLTPFMIQAGAAYNAKYHFECERTMQIMNKFSAIRFNRYSPGQIMRQHHDHIHSLWNTQDAGIPVLSFILNLNDDYEGADLYFWDDYIVPLGKGDIIMFPSLFLYPHGVTEATRGRRFSAVSWGW